MTSEKSDTVPEVQRETEKPKTLTEPDKILFMKLTNVYSEQNSLIHLWNKSETVRLRRIA